MKPRRRAPLRGRPGETREIDAVAQYPDPLRRGPERHQPVSQAARHRDEPGRMRRRPANPAPRYGVVGDQIEVAAACGDDHRPAERAAEQHRGNPVRVEIMGVDQIEVAARANLPAQPRQHRGEEGQWRRAHADLGQQRIARVIDVQPVPHFLRRHPGQHRIAAEARRRERKPRTRSDDPGLDLAAFDQLSQPRLDKNPVLGARGTRI